jgi:hypothetical protein
MIRPNILALDVDGLRCDVMPEYCETRGRSYVRGSGYTARRWPWREQRRRTDSHLSGRDGIPTPVEKVRHRLTARPFQPPPHHPPHAPHGRLQHTI